MDSDLAAAGSALIVRHCGAKSSMIFTASHGLAASMHSMGMLEWIRGISSTSRSASARRLRAASARASRRQSPAAVAPGDELLETSPGEVVEPSETRASSLQVAQVRMTEFGVGGLGWWCVCACEGGGVVVEWWWWGGHVPAGLPDLIALHVRRWWNTPH